MNSLTFSLPNLKNADISKLFSGFSITSILIAITAMGIESFAGIENSTLNFIGPAGMIGFVLPFLIFQVVFTAGVARNTLQYTEINLVWKIVFYLLVFPFTCTIFISAVDSLVQFTPQFHYFTGEQAIELRRISTLMIQDYTMVLYGSLTLIGLAWRKFKREK